MGDNEATPEAQALSPAIQPGAPRGTKGSSSCGRGRPLQVRTLPRAHTPGPGGISATWTATVFATQAPSTGIRVTAARVETERPLATASSARCISTRGGGSRGSGELSRRRSRSGTTSVRRSPHLGEFARRGPHERGPGKPSPPSGSARASASRRDHVPASPAEVENHQWDEGVRRPSGARIPGGAVQVRWDRRDDDRSGLAVVHGAQV